MVIFGYFAIRAKKGIYWDPIARNKELENVCCTYLGSYQLLKHDKVWCWMGWTNHYPKNGDSYVSPDKTPIYLQTGLYLGSRKPWYPNIYHFGFDGCA